MKKHSVSGTSEKGGKSFISGVFVLSLSTFIVKFIGLAYKIPMMSLLGAEGMGYFNSAYEIYALLCVISTAGLPVALSMLVSAALERGRYQRVKKIYGTAMTVFLLLGVSGCLAMTLFSGEISEWIENPQAYASVVAIAPALIFVCISSAVRGYFQGFCRMMPTALSQLIEAVCKLFFGIIFAKWALDAGYGIPTAAAAAIIGLSLGTLLSALYLLVLKAIDDRKIKREKLSAELGEEKKERILGTLFKIAVPITLSSAVLSLTRITDMALIMKRLQDIGYTSAGANEVYGSYTTLAVPVFSLIPSLITPIALALVPQLSAAIERRADGAQSDVVGSALRITVLFSLPASMGISVYAPRILDLLFPNEAEAAAIAAPLLSLLGISIIFACLITTTNAILQSYRKTSKPIISMAAGALVKIAAAYILIGNEEIGIYGAPISTLLCNITITVINLYYINKYVPRTDGVFQTYMKPFAASCVMTVVSFAVYLAVSSLTENLTAAFIAALPAALLSYLVFALLFGAITKKDMLLLPRGEKLARFFGRLGIWKNEKNTLARKE
ncbi:MAG: polysaccharide biosynthesis protein [Clostridia bacterium]|nr:polysaccharide biosynthesis protein [Clostridia bacterium]